eukprot:848242-Pleurochrysis_carterae.AAC.1
MAVNAIDVVFPPKSNYFMHTLKHRPLPHSKQECDNRSCVVGVASLFDSKQKQQCTNGTERHDFGKGLRSRLDQQTNYAASLRPIVTACD